MSLFKELLGMYYGAGHGRHHDRHGGRHHRSGPDDWGARRHGDYRGWDGKHAHGSSLSYAAPLLALAMRNKSVGVALLLLALVLLVTTIVVLVSLLPFLVQTLGFVGQNGIKGVLEQFAPILNLLWNGSGK